MVCYQDTRDVQCSMEPRALLQNPFWLTRIPTTESFTIDDNTNVCDAANVQPRDVWASHGKHGAGSSNIIGHEDVSLDQVASFSRKSAKCRVATPT